jgi:N-acetylglucosaminyldiphosphoundecaprenol N-acetyl-beta-D-mannosaminyltransferase
MIDKGKKNLLGVYVNAIDYEAAVAKIIAAAKDHTGMAVSAVAVHGVMTGVLDPVHRYRLNHFDLLMPDGQPVRWALNWLHGCRLHDRVYGPQLMMDICARAQDANLPIYLYGSQPAVLQALTANLQRAFPKLKIAGAQPSRFRRISADEKEEIIQFILLSKAAITFVGLGCPRQEIWVYEYRQSLCMPLIAVGAAFDFHAGRLPQAPEQLQRSGLEWLFRLAKEPRRLWKRYLLLNPLFVWYLLLQKSRLKQFDPYHNEPPDEELRYG